MKSKDARPPKLDKLLEIVKKCIESENYLSCLHLEQREKERQITRREVWHVLLNGFHEKKKDTFNEIYHKWHYAIRGLTLDAREIRVFISFDETSKMLIITTNWSVKAMEEIIQDQFIDYGCGFPILLRHVPMIKIDGKWIPNINYSKLEKIVSMMLCRKQTKLTGHEIRFIRLYLEMTIDAFAKRFGVKHPTVIKWENFKDKSTNMSLGTEKDIRLCLISHLTNEKQISSLYTELATFLASPAKQEVIELDLDVRKIAI